MNTITWDDFQNVELRAGTIIEAHDFPEAKRPAYIVVVDFGEFGIKKTSAQITVNYTKEELLGKKVVCVVNFPPKQIGPIMSEFLITGFYRTDGSVILAVADKDVHDGARLG
jgi:tRNA-binding protein